MLVRAGVHDGTLLKKLKEEPHDDFFYLELSENCTSAIVRPLARADKHYHDKHLMDAHQFPLHNTRSNPDENTML